MRKKIFIIVCFFSFVAYAYYASYLRISKNFYEVDPGKLYRSAQLRKTELEEAVAQYGIKTVISLRGNPPGLFGDEPEAKTLSRLNVAFHPVNLRMDSFPEKDELLKVLDLLKTAPKPILIHCRNGSDRTGMIAAIYAFEQMHQSKEEALKQLSIKYWHMKLFRPRVNAFAKLYKSYAWAKNEYDACLYRQYLSDTKDCDKNNVAISF